MHQICSHCDIVIPLNLLIQWYKFSKSAVWSSAAGLKTGGNWFCTSHSHLIKPRGGETVIMPIFTGSFVMYNIKPYKSHHLCIKSFEKAWILEAKVRYIYVWNYIIIKIDQRIQWRIFYQFILQKGWWSFVEKQNFFQITQGMEQDRPPCIKICCAIRGSIVVCRGESFSWVQFKLE